MFKYLIAMSIMTSVSACGADSYLVPFTEPPLLDSPSLGPLDEAWASLIEKATNQPFSIESRDEANHSMVVVLSTDKPSRFIDCGWIRSRWDGWLNGEYIKYADYLAISAGAKLEGRITIQLEPVRADLTLLKMISHYVFELPDSSRYRATIWTFDRAESDTQDVFDIKVNTSDQRQCQSMEEAEHYFATYKK